MKVALLGTGLLGSAMARQLIRSEYDVTVYNRTIEKTEPLRQLGAKVAQTPKEAVYSAECSILMLNDAGAINQTLFPSDRPIDFENKTIIQMGTILPNESLRFKEQITAVGGDYLEAPVLGSIPQAQERKLIVMVGGSASQFEKWKGLFKSFGEEIHYVGEVGKAAALKLALNQLIASLTAAFSLSLGIVRRRGIDVEVFMNILRNSALYAPTFDKKLPRMLERDFSDPNFPTKNLLKDVTLIYREAEMLGLAPDLVEAVIDVIKIALQKGLEDMDYSSIYNAIDPQ